MSTTTRINFQSRISVPLVKTFQKLPSLEIGKPSLWNPNQYLMITHWDNEESLKVLLEKWNEAHIRDGMENTLPRLQWIIFIRLTSDFPGPKILQSTAFGGIPS